ncbi:PREDICTED: epithelial-stromal interaction protein 1 isoform X2 [Dipodomys ordii]|uniref:Epithelial-stromal interaction protein 1 isoform X2 n=1 Tax=Dipodomys ordii TaxID=10020 RepID=A0A1S3EQV5_DIPOR|nr:PREDICTED: epithelial-stromal interaction protein 1 isoform X2 [Dipodomys ordii]
MYTHSKVVGTRSNTSNPSGNPSEQHGGLNPLQSQKQGLERGPQGPALKSSGHVGQRSANAYTLIAPNEKRRQQIQRIAEQELANLEKWKQQNRPKPIHLVPRRLGGNQSESEVRKKQQLQLMQSKYQQKLKREESLRIKKEAEEAELQRMKAIQREKSNKLEEKKRLQEDLRRERLRDHHQSKTAEFLSRLDTELPNRRTCQTTFHDLQSATWNKLLEPKRQQQEEERAKIHQTEHRRVNNAFLDRLQGTSQPGGLGQSGGYCNMNSANSWDI